MSKPFYLIFLSVASAGEVGTILGFRNEIVELVYFFMLIYVIITYLIGRIGPFVWTKGLTIIGLASLVSLILMVFGGYSEIAQKVESAISLYVWIRSVKHMAEIENKNLEE
jgi:hypothetical protein